MDKETENVGWRLANTIVTEMDVLGDDREEARMLGKVAAAIALERAAEYVRVQPPSTPEEMADVLMQLRRAVL